jgi:hypothetical protein
VRIAPSEGGTWWLRGDWGAQDAAGTPHLRNVELRVPKQGLMSYRSNCRLVCHLDEVVES